eukprot:gnl/Dysnectes_brevis/4363_a5828_645.p1 GENE.gnl/Dysnectes_brevis/4363_a5828_645~~gnl/Dysnectes_brevis/4363_a5828_645.p1  ORF type:complete len:452 (-),score=32.69 gnl/Dysnectes_brevis/4363_a5828_645:98-1453(-)
MGNSCSCKALCRILTTTAFITLLTFVFFNFGWFDSVVLPTVFLSMMNHSQHDNDNPSPIIHMLTPEYGPMTTSYTYPLPHNEAKRLMSSQLDFASFETGGRIVTCNFSGCKAIIGSSYAIFPCPAINDQSGTYENDFSVSNNHQLPSFVLKLQQPIVLEALTMETSEHFVGLPHRVIIEVSQSEHLQTASFEPLTRLASHPVLTKQLWKVPPAAPTALIRVTIESFHRPGELCALTSFGALGRSPLELIGDQMNTDVDTSGDTSHSGLPTSVFNDTSLPYELHPDNGETTTLLNNPPQACQCSSTYDNWPEMLPLEAHLAKDGVEMLNATGVHGITTLTRQLARNDLAVRLTWSQLQQTHSAVGGKMTEMDTVVEELRCELNALRSEVADQKLQMDDQKHIIESQRIQYDIQREQYYNVSRQLSDLRWQMIIITVVVGVIVTAMFITISRK